MCVLCEIKILLNGCLNAYVCFGVTYDVDWDVCLSTKYIHRIAEGWQYVSPSSMGQLGSWPRRAALWQSASDIVRSRDSKRQTPQLHSETFIRPRRKSHCPHPATENRRRRSLYTWSDDVFDQHGVCLCYVHLMEASLRRWLRMLRKPPDGKLGTTK